MLHCDSASWVQKSFLATGRLPGWRVLIAVDGVTVYELRDRTGFSLGLDISKATSQIRGVTYE